MTVYESKDLFLVLTCMKPYLFYTHLARKEKKKRSKKKVIKLKQKKKNVFQNSFCHLLLKESLYQSLKKEKPVKTMRTIF